MRTCRSAFTLLELLLATTLAAMLMFLILIFSASIRRTQASAGHFGIDQSNLTRLVSLIQSDLVMANEYKMGTDSMTIDGYYRLNRHGMEVNHGPTRVVYRLVKSNGHGHVLRWQSELDNKTNRDSQVELVLTGVKSFAIQSQAGGSDKPLPQSSTRPSTRPATRSANTGNVWLVLTWEDPAIPPLRKLLVRR